MAKDLYHDLVKRALVAQGWTITHDPFTVEYGPRKVHIDLGAERLIAAERNSERIAVEVKSFLSLSALADLYEATGQYIVYLRALARVEPERHLYLALPTTAYEALFSEEDIGQLLIEPGDPITLNLIVFSVDTEEIVTWIP